MKDNNFIKQTDSSLVPERVVTTYGNDGSKHTSFVYSLETWATFNLFNIFVYVGFILFLIPVISGIFLLFFILYINAKPLPNSHNFFGGISSFYLLIDYHNGWLISSLIGCFFSYRYQYWMMNVNMALLIVHTFLFFFGKQFVAMNGNKASSVLYIIGLTAVSFIGCRFLIDNHIISFIIKSIE